MRWKEQSVEQDATGRLPGYADSVVRTFRAPDSLDVRFHEVRAKSALNRVPAASRVPFEWTVNPYRGCLHSCSYCFARPTHEYLEFDAGRDFEREIVVKVNLPEVLRAELARPSWKGDHVALGTNTDPYQWVEKRYGLMRGIWEAFRDAANPCSILTKSPLVLRDADLLQEIAQRTTVSACLSIPTMDEKAWRASEPHTPHPKARLEAVRELNRLGIPTGVLVAPLMPGINDAPEQVELVLEACRDAGAVSIGGQALFLAGSTKQVFMDWLQGYRPDLVPEYERLYESRSRLRKEDRERVEAPLRRGGRRRPKSAPRFARPSETPRVAGAAGAVGGAAGAAGRAGAAGVGGAGSGADDAGPRADDWPIRDPSRGTRNPGVGEAVRSAAEVATGLARGPLSPRERAASLSGQGSLF